MLVQRIYRLVLAIALGVSFISIVQAQPTSGLVAYYPFTGNANDVSGNGNHGVVHGAMLTADRFGNPDKAYLFDGIDDMITIPSSPSLNPVDQLTITLWVRVDSITDTHTSLLHKGGPIQPARANREYYVELQDASQPNYYVKVFSAGDGQGEHGMYSTHISPAGQWVFVATVIDRTNHSMRIYLNGISSGETFDPYISFTNNSHPLTLGRDVEDWPHASLKGAMDDVRIYNRALSSVEIDSLYEVGWASTIVLTSPNGGEAWATGSTHNITWTSNFVDSVTIELSTNNAVSWSTIVASVPASTGNYSWLLPSLPANQCRIRISNTADPLVADTSASSFSITGLVAYYPFTGNANDVSGNGNHGVVHGAMLTADRFGNPASSYHFDGISHSIQVPHSPSFILSPPRQFSFIGWINIVSYQHQAITFKGAANTPPGYFNEWAVVIEPDSTLRFKVNENQNNTLYSYLQSSPSLELNKWLQVAATWDGLSNTMKLYLDSAEVGSLSGAVSQMVSMPGEALYLGYVGDGRFDGKLDDVRIYNRALALAEIDSLYHLGGWPPPIAPQLVFPANASIEMPLNPTLHWAQIPNAELYRLQVSVDSLFVTLVTDDSTLADTSYSAGGLLPLTGYYWRVAARNTAGISPYSASWSFRTIGQPNSVTLNVPSNEAVNQPTNVQFQWFVPHVPTDDVNGYWFEVVTDTLLMTGLLRDTTLIDTTINVGSLLHSTTYYWHVKAKSIAGWGSFSSWWRFTTIIAPPATPQLASPADGSSGVSFNPILLWGNPPNTELYRLQVDTDPDCATPVLDDSLVAINTRSVTGLQANTTYFWRVQARNFGGSSPWSSIWSFTTAVSSTTQYDFTGGWNIVSVPLEVGDYQTEIVFPPAVSGAYSFEQGSGYVRKDTLDNGVGYWIKFGSAETIPITGAFRTHDTVAVVAGWNLIGSLSSPVDTSAIQQIPPAILSSGFYGYAGSYAIADTLRPARGYWVKASAPGILILSPNVGKEIPMMKPVGEETKQTRR